MVLITSLSLFSFDSIGEVGASLPNMDKIAHFSFHFGIMLLGALALNKSFGDRSTVHKNSWKIFVFSVCYGILIEVLQYQMPYGRQADILDVFANVFGAASGGLLIKKCRLRIDKLK